MSTVGPTFLHRLGGPDEETIRIPKVFRMAFLNPIPKHVTFSFGDGRIWSIKIEHSCGVTRFGMGWYTIRLEYGLVKDDTVELTFDHESHFSAKAHLRYGIEFIFKRYDINNPLDAYPNQPRQLETSIADMTRTNGFTQADVDAAPIYRRVSKPDPDLNLFKETLDQRALSILFAPHYFIRIPKNAADSDFMLIFPEKFADAVLEKGKEHTTITLYRRGVGCGDLMCKQFGNKGYVVGGWHSFTAANELQPGDAIHLNSSPSSTQTWNVIVNKAWATNVIYYE